MAIVRIPGALRSLTAGADEVVVGAATVRDALAELDRKYPGIAARVLDGGAVKPFIRIYVGADDIGALSGLDTAVSDRDEIAIVPAIAGGMRDEQVQRYARHIQLPDIGPLGQTAILVSTAHLVLREPDPSAELIAGNYLAAGGVGVLVATGASDAQRAQLAAHGPDTRVLVEVPEGVRVRNIELAARPAWWPSADGDEQALAFWRGGFAATRWLADTAK
jgi:molybdopterin synthase sulfur carrier subunit